MELFSHAPPGGPSSRVQLWVRSIITAAVFPSNTHCTTSSTLVTRLLCRHSWERFTLIIKRINTRKDKALPAAAQEAGIKSCLLLKGPTFLVLFPAKKKGQQWLSPSTACTHRGQLSVSANSEWTQRNSSNIALINSFFQSSVCYRESHGQRWWDQVKSKILLVHVLILKRHMPCFRSIPSFRRIRWLLFNKSHWSVKTAKLHTRQKHVNGCISYYSVLQTVVQIPRSQVTMKPCSSLALVPRFTCLRLIVSWVGL